MKRNMHYATINISNIRMLHCCRVALLKCEWAPVSYYLRINMVALHF